MQSKVNPQLPLRPARTLRSASAAAAVLLLAAPALAQHATSFDASLLGTKDTEVLGHNEQGRHKQRGGIRVDGFGSSNGSPDGDGKITTGGGGGDPDGIVEGIDDTLDDLIDDSARASMRSDPWIIPPPGGGPRSGPVILPGPSSTFAGLHQGAGLPTGHGAGSTVPAPSVLPPLATALLLVRRRRPNQR